MTRFAINPPDEDRFAVNPEHEADQIRQQNWDVFVASLRDYAHEFGWPVILYEMSRTYECRVVGMGAIRALRNDLSDFAEFYGFPELLRAVAQALRADEQFKREAECRR